MWYKQPWFLMTALIVAICVVAGTGAALNQSVIQQHQLEQKR